MMEVQGVRSGQHIRVTLVQARRGWQGRSLVTIPAGTYYDGVVHALTADGFFDLRQANGDLQPFNAYDRSVAVIPREG